ncbi:site-specific DNA-methyltransferase, partial [Rodentibacter genomosp. 2]
RQSTIDTAETTSSVKQNLIIQGDNLEALKSLLPFYAGQVKCIFIDPPYNTKSAFSHYDDNLEHSVWLSMMYPRLELLRELLSEEGSIWITLDDSESHYFKVMMDEIFGRQNFISNLIWEKKRKPSYLGKIGKITDNLFCYAKDKKQLKDLTYLEKSDDETYPLYNAGNSREKLIFPPKTLNFQKHKDGVYPPAQFTKKTSIVSLLSELIIENQWNKNEVILEGEWRYSQKSINEQLENGDFYIVKSLDFRPRRVFERAADKKKIHNLVSRVHYDMATNEDSANEHLLLFSEAVEEDSFDYPKPEKLLQFIIESSTQKGDLVLDSFLGSGTTAAVAHKMHRRYIGIEIGEHAKTHVVPRLKKVIEGEQGGVSKAVNWQGGGSFRFCELGETVFDEFGSIHPNIKFEELATHIWYLENHEPLQNNGEKSPLIGVCQGKSFYLLYNGILGDKRQNGGNVLTKKLLSELPHFTEFVSQGLPIVVYGEACRLSEATLNEQKITFKQIPYDV